MLLNVLHCEKAGDELLEINGNSTEGLLHSDAITIIKHGGPVAKLIIRRGPDDAFSGGKLLIFVTKFLLKIFVVILDGQQFGSNETEMMRQMSLSDGYPSEQHGSGLPNNQGYSNNPPMMNKEYQT